MPAMMPSVENALAALWSSPPRCPTTSSGSRNSGVVPPSALAESPSAGHGRGRAWGYWTAIRARASRAGDQAMGTLSSVRSCGATESRFAIVGDVHGDDVRLARMLESVLDDQRRVVLVG